MSFLQQHIRSLVSQEERHLKVRALDPLEYVLLILSGLCLLGFTITVFLDVATRLLQHPILWLQEATLGLFIWGVFIGASAALRRREHFIVTSLSPNAGARRRWITESFNGLVLLVIGLVTMIFGYDNFLQGFGNHLSVTKLPLSIMTGSIPVFGVLTTIFALERLVTGWRNGFASRTPEMTEIERLTQEVWE